MEATWQGLLTGVSTAATDPEMAGLPVDFRCRVPDFVSQRVLGRRLAWRLDPGAQFALVAAREACQNAGLNPREWDPGRVGVVLGVGGNSLHQYEHEFSLLASGRAAEISALAVPRSMPSTVAAEIGLDLDARGPNLVVSATCASGTAALGTARDFLWSGSCDIVITGGAEAPSARIGSATFGQLGALSTRARNPAGACRPFDRDRDGFVLGEGAGVLVLERADHARARGARAHAVLAGFGASCDAHHFTAPHPEGRGAAAAMRQALHDADLAPADIDHINAHGTATRLNDQAELQALRDVFGQPPPVTALKSIIGHSLGAAGGIEATCTVLTLGRQVIPPTANFSSADPGVEVDVVCKDPRPVRMRAAMSQSFGFGGQNAVAVFTSP
ncbi:beta-ketoacyl-[acyl-carrier-protein] synthase family protein [Streptomyces sirii]|uniref:beta-ketoacyl-[acyl-carrier-protein] synthase family protein n=1 Tax=Streptomyces sirii TaxID=3127701 RepID=UPI003D35AD45